MDDVYAWDQALSQGLLLSVDHATLGTVDLPGSPIRFDDNPFSGGRSDARRSPDARPAQRVDPGVAGLADPVSPWPLWTATRSRGLDAGPEIRTASSEASAQVDDRGDRAAAVRALVGGRDRDEHGRVAGDGGGDAADAPP